jgi:hypothetical protein
MKVVGQPRLGQNKEFLGYAGLNMDTTEQRQAEEKLRATNEELTRFNRAMVDRELRMIELKKEVNHLCQQVGYSPRYPLKFEKNDEKVAHR